MEMYVCTSRVVSSLAKFKVCEKTTPRQFVKHQVIKGICQALIIC